MTTAGQRDLGDWGFGPARGVGVAGSACPARTARKNGRRSAGIGAALLPLVVGGLATWLLGSCSTAPVTLSPSSQSASATAVAQDSDPAPRQPIGADTGTSAPTATSTPPQLTPSAEVAEATSGEQGQLRPVRVDSAGRIIGLEFGQPVTALAIENLVPFVGELELGSGLTPEWRSADSGFHVLLDADGNLDGWVSGSVALQIDGLGLIEPNTAGDASERSANDYLLDNEPADVIHIIEKSEGMFARASVNFPIIYCLMERRICVKESDYSIESCTCPMPDARIEVAENDEVNVRLAPGLTYTAEWAGYHFREPGESVPVVATVTDQSELWLYTDATVVAEGFTWMATLSPAGETGWIASDLVTVVDGFDPSTATVIYPQPN